jgi:DNA-binding NtrC family response regulator
LPSTQTGASGRTPDAKLQVLVLDDEPIVGKRLKLALSKMGCEVEAYNDPAAAFRRLDEKEFDVVISDIVMGEIDGLQVMDRVQQRSPRAKVIMITGYAMMSMLRSATEKGAFDFIARPFTPDDLRSVVARAAAELGVPLDETAGTIPARVSHE